MGRRWRSRSICLRILLIALVIQGVTPDANDLSSLALLRQLYLVSDDSNCSATEVVTGTCDVPWHASRPPDGGSAPSRDTDQDEMPDEVCLPARFGVSMTFPQEDGSTRNAFVPSDQGEQLFQSIHLRLSRSYDIIAGCIDLIHFLCHLTC